jgi:hypothetical protein
MYAAGHALNGNATHGVRDANAHLGEPSTAAGGCSATGCPEAREAGERYCSTHALVDAF